MTDDLDSFPNLAQRARSLAEGARALEEVLHRASAAPLLHRAGDPERAAWNATVRARDDAGVARTCLDEAARALGAIQLPGPERRRGAPIITFSGGFFWPLDPRPEEVDPRDLTFSLWTKPRWNGHARVTIGEHSLRAAWAAGALARLAKLPAELVLLAERATLLHDGNEAYLPDIPAPVKPFVPGWADIEAPVQTAVWGRFGLGPAFPEEVDAIIQQADLMVRSLEVYHFFGTTAQLRLLKLIDQDVPPEVVRAAFPEDPGRQKLVNREFFAAALEAIEVDRRDAVAVPPAEAPKPAGGSWRDAGGEVGADDFRPPEHLRDRLGDA